MLRAVGAGMGREAGGKGSSAVHLRCGPRIGATRARKQSRGGRKLGLRGGAGAGRFVPPGLGGVVGSWGCQAARARWRSRGAREFWLPGSESQGDPIPPLGEGARGGEEIAVEITIEQL